MENVDKLLDEVRKAFAEELEKTGAYNKAGMQAALDRAIVTAVLRCRHLL